jgi:hypothetical protein
MAAATAASNKKTLLKLLQHHKDSVALIESLLTGTTLDAAPAATAGPASDAGSSSGRKSTKGIKRGPRGSSGFDLFKKRVRAEMAEKNPGVKFSLKEVADECAARKAAGQYDEAYWKAQATALKTETSAAGGASDGESAASSDSKKRGRPKGSKNKAKEPAPAPAPATADEEAEEEIEAEVTEWTWKGKVYFKTDTNDVFENIDGTPGDALGAYNPLKDRIE